MSRKGRVQRTPEEKWQIVLEGLKQRQRSRDVPQVRDFSQPITAGRMKWKRRRRLRLGRRAAAPPDVDRRNGSSNWSGRWAGRTCRLRS
jgi:hypothetical protein